MNERTCEASKNADLGAEAAGSRSHKRRPSLAILVGCMNELFTAAAATAAPAEILALEPPLREISRSKSKARAMGARHRQTNVIELRRLRAETRRHMDGKGDFSRFSKTISRSPH